MGGFFKVYLGLMIFILGIGLLACEGAKGGDVAARAAVARAAVDAPHGAPAASLAWQPERTWVFVVGTLEWQDSASLASFDPRNRRDAELVDFFKEKGVPAERIVYLQDRQATGKRIREGLRQLLVQANAGDTLFLYYCGHGYKDDAGRGFFAGYDAGGDIAGWAMDSIPALIGETFRGDRALLAADCCYSGELAKAVERQAGRVGYAVFASSSASELSTGNWTFTEALLDGLRGHAGCDLDDDGRITLAELGRYIAADMRVGEGQLATFFAGGPFPEQSVLALAGGKASPRVGERVKVTWQGQPYNARITDADGDRYRVHWLGFRDYPDEWVAAGTVAFPEAAVAAFARGTIVEVQWKSRWYPATVLDVRDGIFYIHYTGYGSEWDEWVSAKRIRRPAS